MKEYPENKICDYCEENTADYFCARCDEPVCEECCVGSSYGDLIEETRCKGCHENIKREQADHYFREEAEARKITEKRQDRNRIARAIYWLPDNVRKRQLDEIKRQKATRELQIKQLKETFRIVSGMFR